MAEQDASQVDLSSSINLQDERQHHYSKKRRNKRKNQKLAQKQQSRDQNGSQEYKNQEEKRTESLEHVQMENKKGVLQNLTIEINEQRDQSSLTLINQLTPTTSGDTTDLLDFRSPQIDSFLTPKKDQESEVNLIVSPCNLIGQRSEERNSCWRSQDKQNNQILPEQRCKSSIFTHQVNIDHKYKQLCSPETNLKRNYSEKTKQINFHRQHETEEELKKRRLKDRISMLSAVLLPEENQVKSYLDMGCGNFEITAEIGNVFGAQSIIGCDIYPEEEFIEPVDDNSSLGKLSPSVRYIQNISNRLESVENQSVDLITCFMVLHHIEKLDQNLRELSRVLREGGHLYIREHDVPQGSFELENFLRQKHIQFNDCGQYMRFWGREELKSILNSYGFIHVKNSMYEDHHPNQQKVYHSLFRRGPEQPDEKSYLTESSQYVFDLLAPLRKIPDITEQKTNDKHVKSISKNNQQRFSSKHTKQQQETFKKYPLFSSGNSKNNKIWSNKDNESSETQPSSPILVWRNQNPVQTASKKNVTVDFNSVSQAKPIQSLPKQGSIIENVSQRDSPLSLSQIEFRKTKKTPSSIKESQVTTKKTLINKNKITLQNIPLIDSIS